MMLFNGKVIAILRGISPADAIDHVTGLLDNGITDVEIPANSPDWAQSIRDIKRHFGLQVNLGAGTIVTAALVEACAQAGADYVLTPNLDEKVVLACGRHGLKTCIGVYTSTEIFAAVALGVNALKIFPAAALPANWPQLIKGPLSHAIPFCAVGGIDENNMADYLRHYDSVGIGSALYRPSQPPSLTRRRAAALMG
ncbi:bifunctional 4-hydroxy-2-oxoglutarate aldolase/2-dehydro-3-deoxy-phosphogluconate aldolase [Sodalis ligni]|uniref:bifunctional 4-hydroxy-2-oxoglutarate aldolase/2-dehydro-3-deoxy-phosphogluconate aldolase n=1 Tax=Sodalis ligni TaxID=2697027 RepID=UPI0020970D2A|nr:2-dehydro-3-deoxyphosphogluconate aldolase [Sodalis ligni]